MNCKIIKDLLPLYVDECCSEESGQLVKEHLNTCADCRKAFEYMRRYNSARPTERPRMQLHPISNWKASLLQSVMLFASFAILALGVILEGNTPNGKDNGLWAVALIIPATGYLLSLANWFFVRVYKSRKLFSIGSCIATLAFTISGYVWAVLHYADGIMMTSPLVLGGIILSMIFCVLSKILSTQYALLLGRE